MKIPSRARHCCRDQTPFRAGDRYLSVLDEKGERYDYCEACALSLSAEGQYWWGTLPEKAQAQIPPNEQLLDRLRLLSDKQEGLAYLLALYLVRVDMLVKRSKYLFEVPQSGETFRLRPSPVQEEDARQLTDLIHVKTSG